MVAELLLRASESSQGGSEEELRQVFNDFLDYLAKHQLRRSSEELMRRMQQAEKEGDSELWQELMVKKMEMTRKLQGEQV